MLVSQIRDTCPLRVMLLYCRACSIVMYSDALGDIKHEFLCDLQGFLCVIET